MGCSSPSGRGDLVVQLDLLPVRAFLIWTAVGLARHGEDDESDYRENLIIRTVRRVLPTTKNYYGLKLVIRRGSKRLVTPMLIVMISIGTTDVLFALDSIPAIFGLTKEPYLVFTANRLL